MTKTRVWVGVSLLALVATLGFMAAGLRQVVETGNVGAGNGYYTVASMLAVVLFLALSALDHDDGSDTGVKGRD